ncbi:MAG: class I SAM-dependent methyltransferase [Chloroflexi bacterium]|nr:class I SAM-dependent methyltransferase [Chloroflexota bacterium]
MFGRISQERWHAAQALEESEWNHQGIVEAEWHEIVNKYQKVFAELEHSLGLTQDTMILDVGCGPTIITRLFKQGRRYAFDPLLYNLHQAQTIAQDNTNLMTARGEEMPFAKSCFDVAVCRNVLDHTQYPAQVLAEMHRTVKPNGKFFISLYTYAPFVTFVKKIGERISFLRNVAHPFTFTPDEFKVMIGQSGIQVEREWLIHEGVHSTDYGKIPPPLPDRSVRNRLIIWLNANVFRSKWFVREYAFLASAK